MKIRQHNTEITLSLRGGKWQASWHVNGKRYRKSTGTGDEGRAQEIARGFVTADRPGSDITLLEALDKIWREKWCRQTTEVRKTYVKQAADLWNNPRLADITRDMLIELQRWHRSQGTTETTTNRKLQPVITILNKAHHDWQVIPHGAPKIDRFAESDGRYRYFTDIEIGEILEHSDPPFDLIFRYALETGCRRGEIMALTWSMVDFQEKQVLIPGDVTKNTKTRAIPLADPMLAILRGKMQEMAKDVASASALRQRQVFPEATVAKLRRAWDKVRGRLGMVDDEEFVFHSLRHTCATRLTNAGVPTRSIQLWLGHKDIETTVRYLNQSNKDLGKYRHLANCVSVSAHTPETDTGDLTH